MSIFVALHIANVVEVTKSGFRTRASLAANLLLLVTSAALYILSYMEHTRNIRPSSLINVYLMCTLPFDVAQLRTRWLRGDNVTSNGVASSILVIKLIIIVSEAMGKHKLVLENFVDPSPEATSGFYSRGLFWWLNPLFRIGFNREISHSDLFKNDVNLLSESLERRFDRFWALRKYLINP